VKLGGQDVWLVLQDTSASEETPAVTSALEEWTALMTRSPQPLALMVLTAQKDRVFVCHVLMDTTVLRGQLSVQYVLLGKTAPVKQ